VASLSDPPCGKNERYLLPDNGVNSIPELEFFYGIDKFGIEVCYKNNSQITLPFNCFIQKYSFHDNPTGI